MVYLPGSAFTSDTNSGMDWAGKSLRATNTLGTLASMLMGVKSRTGSNGRRSEEHTSELQSLMRISYAVFCLKKKTKKNSDYTQNHTTQQNVYNNTLSIY